MEFVVLIPFLLVPVMWLSLFTRSHRLLYAFRERYPEEATKKMSGAFVFERHSSKFLYFLSGDSAAFLEEKKDAELLIERRSVVRLSIAAVVAPLGWFAIVAALIWIGALS